MNYTPPYTAEMFNYLLQNCLQLLTKEQLKDLIITLEELINPEPEEN